MKIYLTKIILLFAFFIAGFSLFAREVTIFVIDADINLPLEGARVRTGSAGEHICDRQGKVVINVPDNRQIIAQAIYPGYDTGQALQQLLLQEIVLQYCCAFQAT